MHYFKNTELTKLYPISEKAVRNWIDSAAKGKNELQLINQGEKLYIANTAANLQKIEDLIERGKKYKNSRGFKQILPTSDFYKHYTQEQIFDIISHIEVHREIPFKYTYLDGGAIIWNKYTERLEEEKEHQNALRSTLELLKSNQANIDRHIDNAKRVNIIDLGVGNARPVKELLTHLLTKGLLHRYIAIDISKEMLQIAEQNIHSWFNGQVNFEGYIRDFDYHRFKDLLVSDQLSDEETVNIVLLLGGTLSNARIPADMLRTVNNSLAINDLFIQTMRTDTPEMRRYFDFNVKGEVRPLNPQMALILKTLGINEDLYEVVNGFDDRTFMRTIRIRLKIAISLQFNFDGSTRYVELNKGDTILLWRARHLMPLDIIELYNDNGFGLLDASLTSDHGYFLSIWDVRGGKQD